MNGSRFKVTTLGFVVCLIGLGGILPHTARAQKAFDVQVGLNAHLISEHDLAQIRREPYGLWTQSYLPALALEAGWRTGPHRVLIASALRQSAIQYDPHVGDPYRAPVAMEFMSASLAAGYQYQVRSGRWSFAPTLTAGLRYYGPGINEPHGSSEGGRMIGPDEYRITHRTNLVSSAGFHPFATISPEVLYAVWPRVSLYGRLPYTWQITRPDFTITRTVNEVPYIYRSYVRAHQISLEVGLRFLLGKGRGQGQPVGVPVPQYD